MRFGTRVAVVWTAVLLLSFAILTGFTWVDLREGARQQQAAALRTVSLTVRSTIDRNGNTALAMAQMIALQPGNIAAMQYATKVVGFPQQLFAVAIATVIFPILSAQFAKSELAALRTTAFTGLRLTALITIPAAFGLIALARPIISVLFERGEFTPGDVVRTAGAMQFYAVGLLGIAASIVLTRCFFAMHDSKTPVFIATMVMVLNVVASAATVRRFGINGLAASNSLASLVEAAVLAVLFAARVDGFQEMRGSGSFAATMVASAAMGIAASAVSTALWHVPAPFWQHAGILLVSIIAGAVVFVGLGAALRIRELSELWLLVTAHATKRAGSPAHL